MNVLARILNFQKRAVLPTETDGQLLNQQEPKCSPLAGCCYEWSASGHLLFAPALQATLATCLKRGHFDKVFDGGGPEAKGWFY